MSKKNDTFDDGVVTGIAIAVIGGLAVYGAYKVIQHLTASPEEKLLQGYARDVRRLDRADYTIENGNES